MQAVRFVGVGRPASIEDVPKPSPGPGQVLIKIGGAGVCHSGLLVPLGDLSPAKAAPLSDAVLTPYPAVKRALPYSHAGSSRTRLAVPRDVRHSGAELR